MSLDPDTITQQLALLAAHRRTLAHLLQQAAQFGGEVFAPPQTANGIAEARANIARIKAGLREGGVQVEDEPNDEAPLQADVPQTAGAGPRVQSTVTVQDNKGTVIGVQINQPSLTPALHQLRAPVSDFVGREREIDQLVSALSKAATSGAAAAISGIRGLGGIGKTELAYVVANQLKDAFPDAQLVVELRGASANPLPPTQALQALIRSFEREAKLPDDLNELRNIYCSVLAGKQALIVVDDAKDAAQVRPLLPPHGCALLVTSRNRFSLPGMAALDLGTLPPDEAAKLLLEICPRIGEHAAELARLCGYLPLGLRVSASLLANSSRSVGHYLEQLAAERLKHLSDPDDPQASVEASLRLSYDALEPAAQAALGQMSVFPASFDQQAALAVVEVDGDAEAFLDLLQRRSLVEWDATTERYSLHDLVRVFAAARLEDADAVRLRYARHYVGVARCAQNDLYLKGNALAGLRVFDAERTHIDAGWSWALAHAGDRDADRLLLDYLNALSAMADLRYDTRRERIPQLEAQRAAAQRMGRRDDEGYALGDLGVAYRNLGETRKAVDFHEQHLGIARELGDRRGEAAALHNLGLAYVNLGEVRRAIEFYEQSLSIKRELGNRRGEGSSLNNLGSVYINLGDVRKAIDFYEQGLVIAREFGDRRVEGSALWGLGNGYLNLGDARKAITFYEQHLEIVREIGDRRGEGRALGNLGHAYTNLGDVRKAIEFHEQRLIIAREVGDRSGEGAALRGLGNAYADLGDAHTAITFYEQAAMVGREIGDRRGEAIASWNLGLALVKEGDLARAVELMQVRVDFEREIGHPDADKRAARLEQLRQQIAGTGSGTVAGEGA